MNLIPRLGPACERCAEPLADAAFPLCGRCIHQPPDFDRAFMPFIFEEPLRSLIHRFKYEQGLFLGALLAHLMQQSWAEMQTKPQCLIPVPMHKKKLQNRGFNQAALLASLLSKKTGIPCALTACKKVLNTLPQATMNREERQANLRKAFVSQPLAYDHVAIVDDLLTTGSTANELARVLKKAGVGQVDVWCCARALL